MASDPLGMALTSLPPAPPPRAHRAGAAEAASRPLQKRVGRRPFPLLCITLPPKCPLYSLQPHSTLSESERFPFVRLALFFFPFFPHLCLSALPAVAPRLSLPLPLLPGLRLLT